ncbi:Hsp33 family molecular chaperone HslO [Haploplasma modicum]|uniref:Hsp33 family molecular chaperone HslO n=1 Tax=Haploplasma modicum TaxID=2150 RepID=UPI00047EE855|nr:Hsp33 family molecular chaperone HslO [Haploplasma modicum]MCR1808662.1 Hsp33 family molecular chaperone HslO [Haploplasma modicum]
MKNYALIATAYDNMARIYIGNTTNLVEEARQIHKTLPTATAAFGRFLTVSGLMGLMYKDDEKLTLQIKGDGPIGTMLVESNGLGVVRGDIINPNVYIRAKKEGKLDVGAAVGNGFLHITKDLNMKNPFTSSTELVSGEIAEDFANYFVVSEQTPSAVSLGVLVNVDQSVLSAGGFIVQVLPGASDEVITKLENSINGAGPISRWLNDGRTIEDMLEFISNGTQKVLATKELKYECNCSKDRFAKSLSALDNQTMDELIEDDGIEVECHFCKTKYNFTKDELIKIKDNQ